MSAPVVPVPQGGQVLSRPRKEGLFDSEKILAASTTQTLYTFFLSTRTFSDSSASGTKIFQYDTNLIGNGGSIPRGHYLRVFGVQLYLTRRDVQNLQAQGLDDKRKIIDSSTWRLLLGSTPYMDVPTNKIPSGTGMVGAVATTENNITIGEWQNAVANCFCMYDLTVPGKVNVPDKRDPSGRAMKTIRVPRIPIEFSETESFSIQLNFLGTRPTLVTSSVIIAQMYFVSVYQRRVYDEVVNLN